MKNGFCHAQAHTHSVYVMRLQRQLELAMARSRSVTIWAFSEGITGLQHSVEYKARSYYTILLRLLFYDASETQYSIRLN